MNKSAVDFSLLREHFATVVGRCWTTIGKDVQIKLVGKTLYIQASNGKSDWIHNLRFFKRIYKGGKVSYLAHDGFVELWLSIKEYVETLDFSEIVGYSQGAAIALFVHDNYVHRKGVQPTTILFGCPRVFAFLIGSKRNRFSKVLRIENPFDVVTKSPFVSMGYTHVGSRVILKGRHKRLAGQKLYEYLSGHSPEEYYQRLSNSN